MVTLEQAEINNLYDALKDAFTTIESLQGLAFRFNNQTPFDQIVPGDTLSAKIRNFLNWVRDNNQILEFIKSAIKENSSNRKLQKIAKKIVQKRIKNLINKNEYSNFKPLLERLDQIIEVETFSAEFFFTFVELIVKMRELLQQPNVQLSSAITKAKEINFLGENWIFSDFHSEQIDVINGFLDKFQISGQGLEEENNLIKVILVVMTADEAKDLNTGNLLSKFPNDIQDDFTNLKETLVNEGADDWLNRYGENAKDWKPFGQESDTVETIINNEINGLSQGDSNISVEFIDICSLNKQESRALLKDLRNKECIVVIDTISLCHPIIHSNFHESVLDVYSNTFVISISPIHNAHERLEQMSLIIQMKISNMEFSKRQNYREEEYGICDQIHEENRFGRWFSDRVRNIVDSGIRQYQKF